MLENATENSDKKNGCNKETKVFMCTSANILGIRIGCDNREMSLCVCVCSCGKRRLRRQRSILEKGKEDPGMWNAAKLGVSEAGVLYKDSIIHSSLQHTVRNGKINFIC